VTFVHGPVVFLPNGKKVVVESQYFVRIAEEGGGSINFQAGVTRIFDVESGKELQRWDGNYKGMTTDGKKIAVQKMVVDRGYEERVFVVQILDIDSGEKLLQVDDAMFNDFSPDGKKIVVRSPAMYGAVNITRILDVESGKELRRFDGVFGARFLPDGKRLLTALGMYSNETEIRILDAESGEEQTKLDAIDVWGVSHGFSPDGKRIATQMWDVATETGNIFTLIWDAESGERLHKLEGFFWGFSLDGKEIVTLRDYPNPEVARIWNIETGEESQRLGRHVNLRPSPVFSPNGRIFFPFSLYSIDSREEWQLRPEGENENANLPITSSPDGKKIVTVEGFLRGGRIVRILTVEK